jgi:hypothetical protein
MLLARCRRGRLALTRRLHPTASHSITSLNNRCATPHARDDEMNSRFPCAAFNCHPIPPATAHSAPPPFHPNPPLFLPDNQASSPPHQSRTVLSSALLYGTMLRFAQQTHSNRPCWINHVSPDASQPSSTPPFRSPARGLLCALPTWMSRSAFDEHSSRQPPDPGVRRARAHR